VTLVILQDMLGSWDFKSKRQQGVFCPEGLCRAYMFALAVTEQLETWPEQHSRQRQWVSSSVFSGFFGKMKNWPPRFFFG
jgi:hypothetical protein